MIYISLENEYNDCSIRDFKEFLFVEVVLEYSFHAFS